jgi:hypothetical protein
MSLTKEEHDFHKLESSIAAGNAIFLVKAGMCAKSLLTAVRKAVWNITPNPAASTAALQLKRLHKAKLLYRIMLKQFHLSWASL